MAERPLPPPTRRSGRLPQSMLGYRYEHLRVAEEIPIGAYNTVGAARTAARKYALLCPRARFYINGVPA